MDSFNTFKKLTDSRYNEKTVSKIFEEKVRKNPNSLAVVFKDEKLTYQELNSASNKLARALINMGVKSGDVIGIVMEQSIETIIGMISIMKAGATYLPIDKDFPFDRIQYMLNDSNAKLMLIQNEIEKYVQLNISIEKMCIRDRLNVVGKLA